MNQEKYKSNWKKLSGSRNMQENLENIVSSMYWLYRLYGKNSDRRRDIDKDFIRIFSRIPLTCAPLTKFLPEKCTIFFILLHWQTTGRGTITTKRTGTLYIKVHGLLNIWTELLSIFFSCSAHMRRELQTQITPQAKVIHTKYSKQFKYSLYFYMPGQSRPFWAVLKLL